jgi:hypothetical protein
MAVIRKETERERERQRKREREGGGKRYREPAIGIIPGKEKLHKVSFGSRKADVLF